MCKAEVPLAAKQPHPESHRMSGFGVGQQSGQYWQSGTKDSVETREVFISAHLNKSRHVMSGKAYKVQIAFASTQSQILQLQVHVPNTRGPISHIGGQRRCKSRAGPALRPPPKPRPRRRKPTRCSPGAAVAPGAAHRGRRASAPGPTRRRWRRHRSGAPWARRAGPLPSAAGTAADRARPPEPVPSSPPPRQSSQSRRTSSAGRLFRCANAQQANPNKMGAARRPRIQSAVSFEADRPRLRPMKGSGRGEGRRGWGSGLGGGEGGVAEQRVMAAPPNGRAGGGVRAPSTGVHRDLNFFLLSLMKEATMLCAALWSNPCGKGLKAASGQQPTRKCSPQSNNSMRNWDFPGCAVVKTLHSQCRGPTFNPWSGN
ncbi:uncharacterized protein LOC114235713 [Balaenoptera acutorostrata]|uniref:Uncharacterized protein LOC114235713 n=1 Tax=Balaenoptera acutorostrata TaxID=9767 RepID=A0ABM3S762_BALAC|nr:uncharacterized protein LOC114235713 [Balaenoptera acutorostrata]